MFRPYFWLLLLLIGLPLPREAWAQKSFFPESITAYKTQQFDSALYYCDLAIVDFRKKDQQDSVVLAMVHRADIFWETKGNLQAVKEVEAAVMTSKKLPLKHLARVAALNKKAQILVHMAHTEEAAKVFSEAEYSIPQKDTVNVTVASLYNNISWMYLNLHLFREAESFALRSLEIQRKLYGEDARQLMGVYQSLGLIASGAGRFEQAERYSLKLYELASSHLSPLHPTMALVHNQLVVIYESMSRFPEALHHLRSMVDITQKAYAESGNPQYLAIAYNNTGFLYHQLGENALAEAYFEKALRLHQANYGEQEIGIVQPLAHLADAKRSLEKYEEADSLFTKAYNLQSKFDGENIRGLADLESQIGGLSEDRANFPEAALWYTKALDRYRNSGIDGTTMVDETKTSLGKTYQNLGKTSKAIQLHWEVLRSYQEKYPKGSLLIAGKWNRISEAYRSMGDWDKALQYSDSTFLELLQLPALPQANWVYSLPLSVDVADFLYNRIEILEQDYHETDQAALEKIVRMVSDYSTYLERSLPGLRTQTSIVQLAKKQKKLYQSGINSCWVLAEEHKQSNYLDTAFNFAERAKGLLLRLSANNLLVDEYAGKDDKASQKDRKYREEISALNAQYLNTGGTSDLLLNLLARSIEDYGTFQDSLLQSSDQKWAERYGLKPFAVSDIRKLLLKNEETLIEYAVTADHIFAFLINSTDFKVTRQPRQSVLRHVAELQNLPKLQASEFVSAAYPLYELLIKPLTTFIEGSRLIIVPDAELYGINFEVLVSDNKISGFSTLNYLIHQYEFSYLLGASSAIQQNRFQTGYGKDALFFAPGFTRQMNQMYQANQLKIPEDDPIHSQLIRQPFSIQAVQTAVLELGGKQFLEQNAQEEQFKINASKYQLIHLGTHAEVNHLSPLQSRMFFAKPMQDDSTSADGILHAYEVYSMQFQAELAVLSACNTGLGKFQEGEGMVSLAHSFLYAGCASVIMSMWAIDEKTNASILTDFYSLLAKGKRKSAALREAKIEFLEKAPEELSHPYYWAGLGLIGDAASVSFSSKYSKTLLWGIVGAIAISFLIVTLILKVGKKRELFHKR